MTESNTYSKSESFRDERGSAAQMTEAFAGARHPLSAPEADCLISAAATLAKVSEIVKDDTGKSREVPLGKEKLSAGDHTIKLENGRQFFMHVPQNDGTKSLPVLFVISPSVQASQGFKPDNFGAETGMNQAADRNKFIAVYPLPLRHLLGVDSGKEAYAWNARGTGIDEEDLAHQGYNDVEFIKSVADSLPRMARVDCKHRDWGAIAFSQGGMFVNELVHEIPELFPTIGLVGTSMQTEHDYTTAPGNARNVMIVNLRGDRITLPFPGDSTESTRFKIQRTAWNVLSALGHSVAKSVAERMNPLGAIDNRKQDPNLQMNLYTRNLEDEGPWSSEVVKFNTPAQSGVKDTETIIKPLDPQNHGSVHIYDLPTAEHAYPGPERGSRVNPTEKYTEFDTTAKFVEMFSRYNAAESGSRT